MLWVLIASFALLAGNSGTPASKAALKRAVTRPATSSTQPTPKLLSVSLPSSSEDRAAESALLELANQSREQAGLPHLRVDENLTEAARAHARLVVERQELSHQFPSELSLMQRLLETGLRLDHAGENVAYNASAEKAFAALMLSAPHRQNLLNPHFNAAGMAAFWNNGRLYVVQDFAHRLPENSAVPGQ
jgi:uncharacterized protein YkwD